MNATSSPGRIVSMDQFRGYTVAGMFVVNFVGHLAAIHPVLKHHNTYFSFADTIMPSFLFAVGFSYRLTVLRRLQKLGTAKTYISYIRRSLMLVLISMLAFGIGSGFSAWADMTPENIWRFVARLLKADLWEVLAIIGVTQLVIMPVISRGSTVRLLALLACAVGHGLLTYWFNWDFVYGINNNWMDQLWGTSGVRVWDGGFFGPIAWAVSMLAGTLAYDVMAASTPAQAFWRLLLIGAAFMIPGYAMSCLTRLYDVIPGVTNAATTASGQNAELSDQPVQPPFENARGRSWRDLLAEPPFVQPPPPSERKHNYWMMNKRVVTASFIIFASGFAFAAYAVFVLACDILPLRVGVFRTFGQNPLIAYILHYPIAHVILVLVPNDSPLWWCLVGLGVFFAITYGMVRYLESREIYLRL